MGWAGHVAVQALISQDMLPIKRLHVGLTGRDQGLLLPPQTFSSHRSLGKHWILKGIIDDFGLRRDFESIDRSWHRLP
jgi:hypothetical protein